MGTFEKAIIVLCTAALFVLSARDLSRFRAWRHVRRMPLPMPRPETGRPQAEACRASGRAVAVNALCRQCKTSWCVAWRSLPLRVLYMAVGLFFADVIEEWRKERSREPRRPIDAD